ncbi:hypothetical protein ABW19_dt0200231 [Dactylella cylindrospora]|nr:hypothetical protein ABW19_dt0200231 [Dactylella cylindrospora]
MSPSAEDNSSKTNGPANGTSHHTRESSSGSTFTAVNGTSRPADSSSTIRVAGSAPPSQAPPPPTHSSASPSHQLQQHLNHNHSAHRSQTASHASQSGSGDEDAGDHSDLSGSNLQSPVTPNSHPDPKYVQASSDRPGSLKPSGSPESVTAQKRKRSNSAEAGARVEAYGHREMSNEIVHPQYHGHSMPMTNDTRMTDVPPAESGRDEPMIDRRISANEHIAQRASEEAAKMEEIRAREAYEAHISQQLQGGTPQTDHIRSYDPNMSPGMSSSNGINRTPGQPETKRKRIFSNRTKTGCITCRRRKKKCDEGKPECNNCKRGGFVCEGYAGKIPFQGPPIRTATSPTRPSHDDRAGTNNRAPAGFLFSKGQQADSILANGPAPINANFATMTAPTVRVTERAAPLPPLEYSRHPPPPPPPQPVQQPQIQPEPKPFGSTGLPLSGPPPPQVQPIRRDSHITPHPPAPHPQVPHSQAPEPKPPTQASPFSGPRVPPQPPLPQRFSSTEKERMLNGELYHAFTPELIEERERCKAACWRFNNAANPSLCISREEKLRLQMEIFRPSSGTRGPQGAQWAGDIANGHLRKNLGLQDPVYPVNEEPWIETPFMCDYGYNITLGPGVFINFGCTIIDTCAVTIKARTLIGPNVNIYSGTHPLNPRTRNGTKGPEFGKPVIIEEDCWIAGNVTILPGVKIGVGATVGAGAVVTRDVPPHTVVAGNPAKVIKGIMEHE